MLTIEHVPEIKELFNEDSDIRQQLEEVELKLRQAHTAYETGIYPNFIEALKAFGFESMSELANNIMPG